jgi:hypothetical protein
MQQWYYTKNGERQGPVSLVNLQGLAYRGGLDAQKDMVWTDGMPDWKLICHMDDFLGENWVSTEDSFNPYAAPGTSPDNLLAQSPMGSLDEVAPGSVNLDAMAIAKRAFTLTKRHFGLLMGIGITYLVVVVGVEIGLSAVEEALGWNTFGAFAGGFGADLPGATTQHSMAGFVVSTVFSMFIGLGLARCCLSIVSGDEATIATLFSQGPKLINALLASLLFGLMIMAGLLLLIVPGVILMLRYSFFQEAIVDRNLGVIDAFKYSARLTQNNRLNLFGLGVLSILIVLAGVITFFVGLIFAIPLVSLITPLAYRFLQYGERALTDQPRTEVESLRGQCPIT